ncbi:MAG: class I SAM-dependent methyltransferase [Candidatus Odinarchaeota archaeon]
MMKKIEKCRVCGNLNIVDFLDLGKQPFANALLEDPDIDEVFYPLSLSWCPDCNLVQLNHTANPEKLFSEYVWVSSTSRTAREFSNEFYLEIMKRVGQLENNYVLEIASNDGTFLKPFLRNNHRVLGVDPASNIVAMANKDGIPTICRFFGENVAREIVAKEGTAKVVFARNVLAHVANLHDFVKGVKICLDEEGILVIEFHYAKVIQEELHYDSIYHEHLCYFTHKSAERLLQQYNLHIFDAILSPISGGALVLYIRKGKSSQTERVGKIREYEEKNRINELSNWKEFARRVEDNRKKLLEILNELRKNTAKIVGYGASARSSTLLNYCGIDSSYLSSIADQNPLKHNKYTAGTKIKVQSPDIVMKDEPEAVFITAWNFADEIEEILREKFSFKGKIIIPLPNEPRIRVI